MGIIARIKGEEPNLLLTVAHGMRGKGHLGEYLIDCALNHDNVKGRLVTYANLIVPNPNGKVGTAEIDVLMLHEKGISRSQLHATTDLVGCCRRQGVAMEASMIEALGVVKALGGVRALDGATLSVPQGAVYGLAGPNGAGKSTLIRHIAGVFKPDEGSVRVGGRDPFADAGARAGIACVYDEVFAYAHATVRDLARLQRHVYPGFDDDRFEGLRPAFPDVGDKVALRRMSRGLRKQAALWLALSCAPGVLLLDEPVDGLDPIARRRLWAEVSADVAARGMTVLVSTHNLRELAGQCDRVGFIARGRVVADHDAAGLSGDALEDLFVRELGEGGGDE